MAFPLAQQLPPPDAAADAAVASPGGSVSEPSTPREAERPAGGPQEGSSDDASGPSYSPGGGGSDAGNAKHSRAPSPEPAVSLSSLRAASSGSAGTTLQLTSAASDASLSLAALQALFGREPAAPQAPERAAHSARRGGGAASSVVGTFFPVERPRPPPAGDQVNFAQRIMEICFAHTTQWPMALALQFVVDGAPRGAPVDVTVGRSICKSQVSGSRQVIYYVRNPPLLRLARSFDARTVGYRLAGPATLEWHLSTSPNLPAVIPVAKPAAAKRKAPPGGGGGGAAAAAARGGGGADWRGGNGGLGQQLLQQQQEMILRQLGLGDLDASGAAAAAAAALQHVLLPGGAAGAAAAAEALAAVMAGTAAIGGPFAARSARRTKRRKQENPARAPFGCAIGR